VTYRPRNAGYIERSARSFHRFAADPVSRVGSYPSEMIVRLGLIEIARIEAEAVGRSQFPVVDLTYVKAATWTTARGGVAVAHVGDCRMQQFR
jgi:hypothetical protein